MALERYAGKFPIVERNVDRDRWLRFYSLANPSADTSDGTEPFLMATAHANALASLRASAILIANAAAGYATSTGKYLDEDGEALDVPRLGAGVASGYVVAKTSSGTWPVPNGALLKYAPTNQVYRTIMALPSVKNGDLIPIVSNAGGAIGNLPAGTTLQWVSPPVGIASTATVYEENDGRGLSGGAAEETQEEYRARVFDRLRYPPAAGNTAQIVDMVSKIPGLPVQRAFAWPAPWGPGTCAVGFTLRTGVLGDSRIPTPIQIALAQASLDAQLPADDGIVVCFGSDDPVSVGVGVTWRDGADGWIDAAPWPASYADPIHAISNPPNAADKARITSASTIAPPTIGKSIAFYDKSNRRFVRKIIASVDVISADHTYDLTFDTTNGLNDNVYVATSGNVSPWSESLQSLVDPMLEYMSRQGPGEMVSVFNDPGKRQRRFPPPSSDVFPSNFENRAIDGLLGVVSDAEILFPNAPLPTSVGSLGISFYLHSLDDLAAYRQT